MDFLKKLTEEQKASVIEGLSDVFPPDWIGAALSGNEDERYSAFLDTAGEGIEDAPDELVEAGTLRYKSAAELMPLFYGDMIRALRELRGIR